MALNGYDYLKQVLSEKRMAIVDNIKRQAQIDVLKAYRANQEANNWARMCSDLDKMIDRLEAQK